MGQEAGKEQRRALNLFHRMYTPEEIGEASMVLEHVSNTGIDAMAGAAMLKEGTASYTSTVEYAGDPFSQSLKGIAQVHTGTSALASFTRSSVDSTRTERRSQRRACCWRTCHAV